MSRLQSYSKSAILFQKAVNLRPKEAQACIRLCKARVYLCKAYNDIHAVLEEIDKAEDLLSKGVSIEPMNKFDGKDEIQLVRGKCYHLLDDKKRATEHFHNALEINPDCEEARRLLSKLGQESEKAAGDLSKKSRGCFIATAVYGTEYSNDVITLKRFRDHVLLSSNLGRRGVYLYYALSPSFVRLIASSIFLRKLIRFTLVQPMAKLYRWRSISK